MINVVYDRPSHSLKMDGHAYSGEAGHDLVCAAASILAYTLAASATNAAQAPGTTSDIKLESGDAAVVCNPDPKVAGAVTLMYDTVCVGFELLAQNYPENVSYTIIE